MKGYFISVEGGDGSGKSTQMQRIEAYLTEMGQEVLLTREPGGTPMAEKIREMILDPANRDLTGRAEMLLYAAARAQHVEEKILPALREERRCFLTVSPIPALPIRASAEVLGIWWQR